MAYDRWSRAGGSKSRWESEGVFYLCVYITDSNFTAATCTTHRAAAAVSCRERECREGEWEGNRRGSKQRLCKS